MSTSRWSFLNCFRACSSPDAVQQIYIPTTAPLKAPSSPNNATSTSTVAPLNPIIKENILTVSLAPIDENTTFIPSIAHPTRITLMTSHTLSSVGSTSLTTRGSESTPLIFARSSASLAETHPYISCIDESKRPPALNLGTSAKLDSLESASMMTIVRNALESKAIVNLTEDNTNAPTPKETNQDKKTSKKPSKYFKFSTSDANFFTARTKKKTEIKNEELKLKKDLSTLKQEELWLEDIWNEIKEEKHDIKKQKKAFNICYIAFIKEIQENENEFKKLSDTIDTLNKRNEIAKLFKSHTDQCNQVANLIKENSQNRKKLNREEKKIMQKRMQIDDRIENLQIKINHIKVKESEYEHKLKKYKTDIAQYQIEFEDYQKNYMRKVR